MGGVFGGWKLSAAVTSFDVVACSCFLISFCLSLALVGFLSLLGSSAHRDEEGKEPDRSEAEAQGHQEHGQATAPNITEGGIAALKLPTPEHPRPWATPRFTSAAAVAGETPTTI